MDVELQNAGPDALDTPYYVDVYASPGRPFGSSAVLLGSVRLQTLLNSGGSIGLSVPIKIPSNLAAGSYHLIATVYSVGDQVQFTFTRQTFALANSAATPNIVRTIFSTTDITTASLADAWLADAADVLG